MTPEREKGALNARGVVLRALMRVEAGGYSNLVLSGAIDTAKLGRRDGAFAAALFYGVIERKLTLDYIIKGHSRLPLDKLDKAVLCILRMGLYQLLYMNSVPESAAVNESVLLCKKNGKASASGFVNAVLRTFIREGKRVALPDEKDTALRLSVEFSCPQPLVRLFIKRFGAIKTKAILEKTVGTPPLYARVNTTKTTAAQLVALLGQEGVEAAVHEAIPDCISLHHTGDLEQLSAFKDGLFHIQDGASQLCALVLGAKPGMTVLDLCAAPGGKSFTVAERMQGSGSVLSFDLYDFKAELIQKGAQRLGLSIIRARTGDAAVYNPELPLADRVLCDVPCSGFGILRRKPEIKYKPLDSFGSLRELQLGILQNGARYVKTGGVLLYSTCTLRREENEEIADAFLKQNPAFVPLALPEVFAPCQSGQPHMVTILPELFDTDGFFIAAFTKQK